MRERSSGYRARRAAAFILWFALACALTGKQPASAVEKGAGDGNRGIRFFVVSDVHVQHWESKSADKWRRALQDLFLLDPDADALVINGDLGNGLPADYESFAEIMKKASVPSNVFYTIGNHEYYKAWFDKQGNWSPGSFPNGETEQASQRRFLAFAGLERVYYDRWVNGYHFIMLGSEKFRQSDPSYNDDAWLSEQQLDWFEKKLAERERPGKPIFVFLHQPLGETVAGSDTESNKRGVVQRERLNQLLAAHPQVILFSGHTHWELKSPKTFVKQSFTMAGSSSVYEPYNQKDAAGDYDQSEGLAVEADASKVVIRGRDFVHSTWIPEAEYTVSMTP